jgi:hypothetical protein
MARTTAAASNPEGTSILSIESGNVSINPLDYVDSDVVSQFPVIDELGFEVPKYITGSYKDLEFARGLTLILARRDPSKDGQMLVGPLGSYYTG